MSDDDYWNPDLSKCPKCGGEADNGFDRCIPPSPYVCSVCETMDRLMILADDANDMDDWEVNFIDDMEKRRIAKKSFTQNQLDKIVEIYEARW